MATAIASSAVSSLAFASAKARSPIVQASAPVRAAPSGLRNFEGLSQGSRLAVTRRPLSKKTRAAQKFCASVTAELPLVGNKAPDFEADAVFDQEFIKVKLSDYQKQKKYVVLFFYPLDFTFVCPTEITAFSDRHDEFEKLNTEILGVSVDSQFSHLAWIQTERKAGGLGDLKYPLIADLTKEISTKFNVLIPAEILSDLTIRRVPEKGNRKAGEVAR